MLQTLKTYLYLLLSQLNTEDGIIASVSGMGLSVTVASIMSVITDLMMAFGVGVMGATGGLLAKLIWDYCKKRLKR